jgi:hypothetical protein
MPHSLERRITERPQDSHDEIFEFVMKVCRIKRKLEHRRGDHRHKNYQNYGNDAFSHKYFLVAIAGLSATGPAHFFTLDFLWRRDVFLESGWFIMNVHNDPKVEA